MRHGLIRRFSRTRGEDGFALVVVVASMFALTMLAFAALDFATKTVKTSRRDQDFQAAIQAAQAGVDDYLRHLDSNDTYWLNGGVDSANPAFSGYETVPGTGVNGPAAFTYSMSSSVTQVQASGSIGLTVTGRVNKVDRTLTVKLRKLGFLNYVYYSDKEVIAPVQQQYMTAATGGRSTTVADAESQCDHYYYDVVAGDGRPDNNPSLGRANCYGSDGAAGPYENYNPGNTIYNGPVHTNDEFLLGGHPTFLYSQSESSWPACASGQPQAGSCYRAASGGSSPNLDGGGHPIIYQSSVNLPPSNAALIAQTNVSQGGSGCLYTGPTSIVLNGDGSMDVTSPQSRSVNSYCGSGLANKRTPTHVSSIPNGSVIYVQADPSCTASTASIAGTLALSSSVSTQYPGEQVSGNSDNVAYARGYYSCKQGDLFVRGTLKGSLTMGTDGNIIVTGNTTYAGGHNGTDVLGLIANGEIEVYHPVHCSSGTPGQWFLQNYGCANVPVSNFATTGGGLEIDGALLSVLNDFTVQSWDVGGAVTNPSSGNTFRNVFGSVAAKFAPIQGVGDGGSAIYSGYEDNFSYDKRLLAQPPPYFLQPTSAPWALSTEAEQAPR